MPKRPSAVQRLAQDLLHLKFEETDTLKACEDKFYALVRKHGIKQGTPSYNERGEQVGRACNNFEWSMCRMMFIKMLGEFFTFREFLSEVPEDLLQ